MLQQRQALRNGGDGVYGQGEEEEERGESRDWEVCYSRDRLSERWRGLSLGARVGRGRENGSRN